MNEETIKKEIASYQATLPEGAKEAASWQTLEAQLRQWYRDAWLKRVAELAKKAKAETKKDN